MNGYEKQVKELLLNTDTDWFAPVKGLMKYGHRKKVYPLP